MSESRKAAGRRGASELARLDELFTNAGAEYRARKAEAEARVVAWEWFASSARHLEPLYAERSWSRPGDRLPSAPDPTAADGTAEYGIDTEGRAVVEREYVLLGPHGLRVTETLICYSEGLVEAATYDHSPEKPLMRVQLGVFSDGLLRSLSRRGLNGGSVERYTYDGPNVVRIEKTYLSLGRSEKSKASTPEVFEVAWHDAGPMRIVLTAGAGRRPRVVYERPPSDVSLEAMLSTLEGALVRGVPEAVAALRLREQAYSVVLGLTYGHHVLPPSVSVGLEREREAAIAKDGREAHETIWNPAEYELNEIDTPAFTAESLADLCRLVNQELCLHVAWEQAGAMVDRVTAKLRDYAWGEVLPTTSDFVIFAVDVETMRLETALRTAARPEDYRRWMAEGLAPR